jgi:uncharacterized protein YraI
MGGQVRLSVAFVALAAFIALMAGGSAASAGQATTASALALRAGPGTNYERLLSMPAGAVVRIASCRGSWCQVTWNSYAGYARRNGLSLRQAYAPVASARAPIPVYPPYAYRAGHYPTADSNYDLPPYAAISPRWYRKRYFLTLRERGRYRYVPHIFRGYGNADGSYVK